MSLWDHLSPSLVKHVGLLFHLVPTRPFRKFSFSKHLMNLVNLLEGWKSYTFEIGSYCAPHSLFLYLLLTSCLCVSSFWVRRPQYLPLPFTTHFPLAPKPPPPTEPKCPMIKVFPTKIVLSPGGILLPATKRINVLYLLYKQNRNNDAYFTRCLWEFNEVMCLPASGL